jgi:putative ABC transport system permease protein
LVESAGLALGGAAIGLALARAMLRVILSSAPTGLLPTNVGIDARVLTFALALTLLTTVGVGLWPAFRTTKPRIAGALHEGGRAAVGGMRALRARRVLVVAETSLALVLLISAGLVLQSLGHMLRVDPGFRPERVAMVRVTLPAARYRDTTQVRFFRDLQSRLEGRGGIEAMGAANTAPIAGGGIVTPIRLLHTDRPDGGKLMAMATAVTPGYFRTLNIPVLQGRDVAWSDAKATLVVSQSAAKLFWPGEHAVGKRIAFGSRDTIGAEVVGVVGDTHARGITTDVPPMIYLHYSGATSIARTMTLVVRGRGDDAAVIATTRQAVLEIDGTLPIFAPNSVSALIAQSLGQPRLNTMLLSIFAGVALLLAVIGIYGVISYSVTQRAQEIGVRMALGARQRDVLRLVLREGASLAAIGVAIGVAGAFLATPLIRNWLFGIEPSDPVTMLGTSFTLVLVALAASYLPARRASHVDPIIAMRAD